MSGVPELWIQTYTGKAFRLGEWRADDLHPDDITHALVHVNRFTGHTRLPYCVAQHSLLVSRRVRELGGSPVSVFGALLHDASEAYLGDVSKPLKSLLPVYRELERELQDLIEHVYIPDAGSIERDLIKRADLEMLATEAALFFPVSSRPQSWELPYPPLTGYLDGLPKVMPPLVARYDFRKAWEQCVENVKGMCMWCGTRGAVHAHHCSGRPETESG